MSQAFRCIYISSADIEILTRFNYFYSLTTCFIPLIVNHWLHANYCLSFSSQYRWLLLSRSNDDDDTESLNSPSIHEAKQNYDIIACQTNSSERHFLPSIKHFLSPPSNSALNLFGIE